MACLTSVWSISLVTGLPKVGYFLIKKHPLPAKSAMCWIQELIHFAHSPMFPWHSEQSLAQSSCFIKTLDHVWNCGDKNHPSCSQEPQSPLWGKWDIEDSDRRDWLHHWNVEEPKATLADPQSNSHVGLTDGSFLFWAWNCFIDFGIEISYNLLCSFPFQQLRKKGWT